MAPNIDLGDEEFLKFIGSTDEKPWIPGADLGNTDMLPWESHRNVADFDANITDELCTQFLEAEPQNPGSDLLDVLDLERSLRASTIEGESPDGTRHENLNEKDPRAVKIKESHPKSKNVMSAAHKEPESNYNAQRPLNQPTFGLERREPYDSHQRRSQPYVKLEDVCPCTLQGHICMHHGR